MLRGERVRGARWAGVRRGPSGSRWAGRGESAGLGERDGPREREGSGWVGLVSWAGFSSFPFWAEVGLGPG